MSNLPLRFHSLEFGLRFEMQGSGGCSAERRSLTGKESPVIFLKLPLNLVESSHEMCNVDVRPIFIVPCFFILNDVYYSVHVFRILRAGRFRGVRRICQVCQGGAKIA